MELKNDVFIINYSENDKDFAKTLFNQLNENKKRVMDFFELDKVSKQTYIKIYDNLQDFINLRTENGKFPERYKPWNVASAVNGDIHILNFDLYKKAPNHKNREFDDYLKTLVHEFVHVCHEEILKDKSIKPALLMEGIATKLAGQDNYKTNHISCSASELKTNFYNVENHYSYAYTIMEYLMDATSHSDLLEILKEPHKVDVEELVKNTNQYLENKQKDDLNNQEQSVK